MVWCFFLDDKQNPSPASLAVEKLVDQSLVLPHRFPRSQAEWKRLVWVVGEYLALSPETIEQGADSVSKVVAEQQQEESLRPVYRDRYVSFATWSALRVQDAWKQTQTLPLRQPLSPVLESWLESESSSTIIIGQENVKQELRDAILLPQLHYETLKTCNVKFETGILLYGPPGTWSRRQ